MLHQTDPIVPAWHATLAVGDVVAFRFPPAEHGDAPPPARPCLVLAVEDDLFGARALLSYGTAHCARGSRALEIELQSDADFTGSGVHCPTRFIGTRRVWAPLDDPAFCCGTDRDTPILGRLDGEAHARLAEVVAQLPRRAGRIPDCTPTLERSFP